MTNTIFCFKIEFVRLCDFHYKNSYFRVYISINNCIFKQHEKRMQNKFTYILKLNATREYSYSITKITQPYFFVGFQLSKPPNTFSIVNSLASLVFSFFDQLTRWLTSAPSPELLNSM